jgi:D-3-phosphoglycerate dehydrogenase
MVTDKRERSVAGTCFSDGKPRFIQIKGINIDAEIGAHMLYTTNEDVPGIIGLLGMTMGKNNVNIANFTLGRSGVGQDAIAILYLDQQIDPKVIETLEGTGMFSQVKALAVRGRLTQNAGSPFILAQNIPQGSGGVKPRSLSTRT